MDRLQEIKNDAVHEKQHDFFTTLPYEDFLWLVEQVDKAREFESRISKLTLALDICKMESGLLLSLERYISHRGLSYSDSIETLVEALTKN